MNINFKIIIPVFNAEKWINRCIWSVENQTYKNWECVIIDDKSTDNTSITILNKLKCAGDNKEKFRFFQRKKNVGALENIVYGINAICFDKNDVIILLDGDDSLISSDVLEYLNSVYQNENILLTYGQYQNESNGNVGCNRQLKIPTREYRAVQSGEMYWCTSHLRTFKYRMWKKIQDNDLRDWNGKYFAMAWDLCIMYPLLEMCGNDRIQYIEKILYLYNDTNPINDFKKNLNLQLASAKFIKQKLRYRILNDNEI